MVVAAVEVMGTAAAAAAPGWLAEDTGIRVVKTVGLC